MEPVMLLASVFLFGGFVALVAVLIARWQERREGARREVPVALFVAVFLGSLFLFAKAASADQVGLDPCVHLEPWSWYWILIGCGLG
jgi:uncharacterized membrane protein YdcZ (DUF606 family)